MSASAVVFAYSQVGARCLRVLLAHGIDVKLAVSHQDHQHETIWWEPIPEVALDYGIPVILPESASDAALISSVQEIGPDFIFSFYYRYLIPLQVLQLAQRGAYNMHGSLLPKYRGRAPSNWAVLHGESETGATLHAMEAQPDAGAIFGQTRVPILPDDTARQVFEKIVVAAEITLDQALPGLIAGTAVGRVNDIAQGSYFGGRKPEDGRIDWSQSAQQIYNLIRAVAPPYPGAFFEIAGRRLVIAAARLCPDSRAPSLSPSAQESTNNPIIIVNQQLYARCGDGQLIHIKQLLEAGQPINLCEFQTLVHSS